MTAKTKTTAAFRLNGTDLTWTCTVCEKCVQLYGRAPHARKHIKEGTVIRRVTGASGVVAVRFERVTTEAN